MRTIHPLHFCWLLSGIELVQLDYRKIAYEALALSIQRFEYVFESKWELSWKVECFPWAIVVSEGVCVVPTANSHSTNIWTSLQQLRLVTLLGHSSLSGSNEKVVELKEMLQTDVLQNIDHCETVAGGTNHRFLRGLWDIWRGDSKGFFTIKE